MHHGIKCGYRRHPKDTRNFLLATYIPEHNNALPLSRITDEDCNGDKEDLQCGGSVNPVFY